jgi:regulatory protein
MPTIFAMKMRRGRPERFIIELEDEVEVVLTPETVLKYGLALGREFSDDEFLEILQEDSIRQAKDQALRYLANRPHSRTELVRKMRQKGFRNRVIDQALDDLEKIDLINDEDFTRLYILNELRLRPCGKLLLSSRLAEKGIARDLYEPLLNKLFSIDKELEIANRLMKKFIKTHSRDQGRKLQEKLVRYLQSKGFTWEIIQLVMEREAEL